MFMNAMTASVELKTPQPEINPAGGNDPLTGTPAKKGEPERLRSEMQTIAGQLLKTQPAQLPSHDLDLSSLRWVRDHSEEIDAETMANFCLRLEEQNFSQVNIHNLKKIGDFFREVMAKSPAFRENMRSLSIDIRAQDGITEAVQTNKTTFLADTRIIQRMMEDLGSTNPSDLTLILFEDRFYAERAIRFLETGDERELAELDLIALATMASRWESSRLLTYCQNHIERLPSKLDEQFIALLEHYLILGDASLAFIRNALCKRAISTDAMSDPAWQQLFNGVLPDKKEQIRFFGNAVPLEASKRADHPDRVSYSLELIDYVNARLQDEIPADLFYITAKDVQGALRLLFHAALYKNEALDRQRAFLAISEMLSKFHRLSEECQRHKDDPLIGQMVPWAASLCNFLDPHLPDALLEFVGWHGDSLNKAVNDISSDHLDLCKATDTFVINILRRAARNSHIRIHYLLRPTTTRVTKGVFTLVHYDKIGHKIHRSRLQFFDNKYYHLKRDEMQEPGHSDLLQSILYVIRDFCAELEDWDIAVVSHPRNHEERIEEYVTIEYQ